jgi:Concanavalin A-like lectin/glucanases superfamily
MSTINSGLPLVRSGLVVALDAASNRSYSSNRYISYGTGQTTENVTFSINGNGTFQRVAAGTVVGGYTIKPRDVVYSYALGATGCHYHGNTTSIPAGVYATFSFDYLVTGATTYPSTNYLANFENYGGSALGGSVAAANSYQNVWQRATFTSGPTVGSGTQAMFLYPGGCGDRLADSGTVYFRNPKVEFVSADTGNSTFSAMNNLTTWYNAGTGSLNGTLNNGVQYYPNGYFKFDGVDDYSEVPYSSLLDTNSVTIMGVFRTSTNDDTHDTIVSRNSDVYGGANNGWNISRLRSGLSPTNSFRVMVYGNSTSVNLYGPNITDNLWRHYAVVITPAKLEIYINGTLYTSTTSMPDGNFYPASGSPTLKIGANRSNSDIWSGDIASCYVYSKVLSASQISANYQLSRNKFPI